jgi:arylsulfatase A-like enzyme
MSDAAGQSKNTIVIVSDTFRADNLACYGGDFAHTPRLDAFAQQACVFEKAYLSSFPTVPARRDIMSGRFSCVCSEWAPLPQDLVVLQQVLSRVGVLTMMIADTPHILSHGFNYSRGFDGFEWIRGQENDHYRTFPRHVPMPPHPEKWYFKFEETLMRYQRNISGRKGEDDYFAPQSVGAAMRWLEENADEGPFFLYLDLFDPHEPWDAPAHYVDLYDSSYSGLDVHYPAYTFWKGVLTPEELRRCGRLYAAEATMVDHWVGRLLDRIDELGLREDTTVIFTSDHGFLFGEHDFIGKSYTSSVGYEMVPMFQEIIRIPLLVRLAGQETGQRVPALVQLVDLMPTVLELAGVILTETVSGQTSVQVLQCGVYEDRAWQWDPRTLHGSSLVPLMRGEVERVRDIAVSSHSLIHPTPAVAKASVLTEDGWCLHYAGHYPDSYEGQSTVGRPFAPVETLAFPIRPQLYYLPDDPGETQDRLESNLGLAQNIHEAYVAFLRSVDTPAPYLAGRQVLRI